MEDSNKDSSPNIVDISKKKKKEKKRHSEQKENENDVAESTQVQEVIAKVKKHFYKYEGDDKSEACGSIQIKQRNRSNSQLQQLPARDTSNNGKRSNSLVPSASKTENQQNPRNDKKNERSKRGQRSKKLSSTLNDGEKENISLSAETLLILDLIMLPMLEREKFILELAVKLHILVYNPETDNHELNPIIVNAQNSILLCGLNRRHLDDEKIQRLQRILKRKEKNNSKPEDDKKPKFFEDYVNAVIQDDFSLAPDVKEECFLKVGKKQRGVRNYFDTPEFNDKLENLAQQCVKHNLGYIIEGEIRINGKNNDQAFIKNDHCERDAIFTSQIVRKCALHADIVRAFVRVDVNKKEESLDASIPMLDTSLEDTEEPAIPKKSSKAFVIRIIEHANPGTCVGSFMSQRKDCNFITFVPRDTKMPNLRISQENWPDAVINNKSDITDTLYEAKVLNWQNDICYGQILKPIGKKGELHIENSAILIQNNLNAEPYAQDFIEMYEKPFEIPDTEIKKREDIRNECIFTIDPSTARDLDDALSCRPLHDGNFEIGVHISDVAYFLEEESDLDRQVKLRATSVYLVNGVFHMLPPTLCMRCSLLPGQDKLAFTVYLTISPNGDITKRRFAKTVINSCTQLSYEHAQNVIDNPDKDFTEEDFPKIHNGHKVNDIVLKIKQMYELSKILRGERFNKGALKIDNPKLYFILDPTTGEPKSYSVCEQKSANFMIEEFMLLANQTVAKFIYEKYPNMSILRSHLPPIKKVINDLKERLQKMDINFDCSSSKSIGLSVQNIIKNSEFPEATAVCINLLASKPMIRARYFCASDTSEKEDFWHYALSIPMYTHFTSPIRRYPDVLVHRVLNASIEYTPAPSRSPDELQKLAMICNEKKYKAKLAGEDSCKLYFMRYIQSKKSIIVRAAVLEINLFSIDVILIESGYQLKISVKENNTDCKVVINDKNTPRDATITYLKSDKNESVQLKVFGSLWLEVTENKHSLKGRIIPPPKSTSP